MSSSSNHAEVAMKAEEDGILRDIHAHPRSDALRLLYADWLEDHGAPEHAEFIRLQCQQPYVAIRAGDPSHPANSHELPWGDMEASMRRRRLQALHAILRTSGRLSHFCTDDHSAEFARGIPLWSAGKFDVRDSQSSTGHFVKGLPLQVRLSLFLQNVEEIETWLPDPIMDRVDFLHVELLRRVEDSDIRAIAATPLPDRLARLTLYHRRWRTGEYDQPIGHPPTSRLRIESHARNHDIDRPNR
jgi:uncharacterized protein (TIGR02996 family)